MKEEAGGKREEDGGRNATGDGRKIICPKSGVTAINRGVAGYGQEYCYFL